MSYARLGPLTPVENGLCKGEGFNKGQLEPSWDTFQRIKVSFFSKLTVGSVKAHAIPPELIINLDETGIKLVPVRDWTMAPEGNRRVEVVGLGDKRQITVTFADTLSGAFLPM